MDIKKTIENKMDDMRISRAEVCRRMKIAPQGWAKKLTDPKWSTIEDVCQAIGITPAELLADSDAHATGTIICPYCGQGFMVAAIKTEE